MPIGLDVAIVSHNTDYYLFNLLTTLQPLHAQNAIRDVYVWDNASTDRTEELLDALTNVQPWVHAIESRVNVHHGPALDALLASACRSEWVLVLDADTEVRRPFDAALTREQLADATFVGQIHPQVPHLYAYLAHLLVHRPRYFELPPFRHHGAPGIDYFQAIERERRPFVRFRWCDYIHHYGQGSLRQIVEREDRANEFYEFACREARRQPKPEARIARENVLAAHLRAFLDRRAAAGRGRGARARSGEATAILDRTAAPRDVLGASSERLLATLDRGVATKGLRESPRWIDRARDWMRSPRCARALSAARRMGLTQIEAEARGLVRLVETLRPRRVLEIGTAHGGSFLLWSRASAKDAVLVSVDLPPWELDDPAEVTKRRAIERVGLRGQSVHVLRGDSHDPIVQRQACDCLGGEPIDFLFIDGDHSYEGVKQDFVEYGAFVRGGGIVAFRDIHPHSCGWGGEVPVFWREIRDRYRSVEVIAHAEQDGFGIGVIWM